MGTDMYGAVVKSQLPVKEGAEFSYCMCAEFDFNRPYEFFTALAGVRNDNNLPIEPVAANRGYLENLTEGLCVPHWYGEAWGLSWCTCEEFERALLMCSEDIQKIPYLQAVLNYMKPFVESGYMVRFIFAFC